MGKECSPPLSQCFPHESDRKDAGARRPFSFQPPSPFPPGSGKSKCVQKGLAESPQPAAAWPGGDPPPPAPQLSASPPGGPWGLRLDQADPGRPGEAPARSRACRARPAPPGSAVSREGGGQLSAPARAVPGRVSDPLQGESRPGGRHPPPRLPSNQPPGCLRSCLLKFNLSLKHSIKNGLLVS